MDDDRINAALRDATDTQNVTIGAGVLTSVDDVFGQSFGDQPAIVVADENTFAVAGKEVQRRPLSHEYKVGVGSVAIAALYEQVLQRDPSTLDVEVVCRAWPTR